MTQDHGVLNPQIPAPFIDREAASISKALDEVAGLLDRQEGSHDAVRTAEILRWVGEVAQQFTDAPVQIYVPILVEHIVRDRLNATSSLN
jgi:hypothetical protein